MKRTAFGYAWLFPTKYDTKSVLVWNLCRWAQPTRERLERGQKPSPDARAVRVKLVYDDGVKPKRKGGKK